MVNRKRNKQYFIRLTEEEYEKIERKRNLTNKNRTDFILACISKKPIIVIDGLTEILAEMKREGNNLNQITKLVNEFNRIDTNLLNQTLNELRYLYKQMLNISKGKLNANIKGKFEQSNSE